LSFKSFFCKSLFQTFFGWVRPKQRVSFLLSSFFELWSFWCMHAHNGEKRFLHQSFTRLFFLVSPCDLLSFINFAMFSLHFAPCQLLEASNKRSFWARVNQHQDRWYLHLLKWGTLEWLLLNQEMWNLDSERPWLSCIMFRSKYDEPQHFCTLCGVHLTLGNFFA